MLFSWRTWHPFFGNNRYQSMLFALEEGSALKAMRAPLCQVRFELGKVLCIPWHSAWHSIPLWHLLLIFAFCICSTSSIDLAASRKQKRKGCRREAIRKLRTVQTHSNTKSSRAIKHERLQESAIAYKHLQALTSTYKHLPALMISYQHSIIVFGLSYCPLSIELR
jgi:hypothetical protein